jgi:hypothetical protein
MWKNSVHLSIEEDSKMELMAGRLLQLYSRICAGNQLPSYSPHLRNALLCNHLPALTTLPSIRINPSAAHRTAIQ